MGAAQFADLPLDAVQGLERLSAIASLSDLPVRGNQVGAAWFGVADDYLMAPFVVLSGSLKTLLGRAAFFHALVAPLAVLIGVALRRPLLGFAWGLVLAGFPDLAALSRDYPVNYRTTHWALLGWAASLCVAQPGLSSDRRARWTGVLLFAGALMVASHPLAAAGLPAVLLVAVVYGAWRPEPGDRGTKLGIPWWLPGALAVAVLLPYALSNLNALQDLLQHDRGDQGMSMGAAWRGSLAAIKGLPTELSDLPGGLYLVVVLLLGVPLTALRPAGRPVLLFVVLWTLGSLFVFALAGYSASPWHLFPLVLPVLGLGLAGWFLLLGDSDGGTAGRLRGGIGIVASLLLILVALPAATKRLPPTDDAPVVAYGQLTDQVVALAAGRSFQYLEAQSRCAMDWSAEATVLDLGLRGAPVTADPTAPLLAVVEDVPALEGLALPGFVARMVLPNRMAVRLYWTADVAAWTSSFNAWCGIEGREVTTLDVHLKPGGTASGAQAGDCVVPMPCPSYLREEPR